MKKEFSLLRRLLKPKDRAYSSDRLDNSVRDLIELIHLTEEITSKLHAALQRNEILDIVETELGKLANNHIVILLLDKDGKSASIRSITVPAKIMKAVNMAIGSPVSKMNVDISNSIVFRRVIDDKETYAFKTIEWIKEVLPGPLAYTVAGITGHLQKTTVVSPLTIYGKVIGIFAMDSHEMVDVFLLSVKNLTQHISAAMERSEENRKRDTLEDDLRRKEAFIRSIFMAAPVGIGVAKDRIIIAINRHIAGISGYTEEELVGRDARIFFINDEEYERVGRVLYGNYGEGHTVVETEMKRKDGTTIDVILTSAPVGGTGTTIVTMTDITERKRTERALAESETSFRAMFEITSEGVALVDPVTGCFIAANPAMCMLFGYSEEEFRSLTPEDITPYEAKGIMRDAMKTLADGGNVADHEGVNIRKDGSKINVIVSNRHMVWHGKRVYHITFKDITSLKEIQEQLRKKNLEIIEFTNTVNHDLRKPLTALKIIFDLANKGALGVCNNDGIEAITTGIEAANYMQEMLEDLMVCASLDTGKQELVIETTGFREISDTVIARLKYQIEEKKIAIETAGGDVTVNADKKQLTRALMNLVGNAVKYIGEGPDKCIKIGWEQRNGAPIFFIEDNGIGIPSESRQYLFTKFKRGNNVSGIPGTGLGLAIVKGIIEAHGGTIWVESEIGKGSLFRFTLGKEEAAVRRE